jgi:hypothetical protein
VRLLVLPVRLVRLPREALRDVAGLLLGAPPAERRGGLAEPDLVERGLGDLGQGGARQAVPDGGDVEGHRVRSRGHDLLAGQRHPVGRLPRLLDGLDNPFPNHVGPPAQHDAEGEDGLRLVEAPALDRGEHGVEHLLQERARAPLDDYREGAL